MTSPQPLAFGNDMSRIVRGIAIILMVAGHTMPGRVVAFAVPLFSFLVGYGYNFARQRNLRHSLSRSWHLLANFWFILFAVCIPLALVSQPKPINFTELLLNMFGLNGRYNFYCWYIYFYLIAMALLPCLSRLIDRWGWKAVVGMALLFGAGAWGLDLHIAGLTKLQLRSAGGVATNVAYRTCRYMPIVLAAYQLARTNFFAKIKIRKNIWALLGAVAALAALYFFRKTPYVKALDLVWAPVAAGLVAALFGLWKLAPLRWLLTQLGLHSMGIWFLHALFFTHTTRKFLVPLVAWTPANWWRPLPILLLSWLMAVIVAKAYSYLPKVWVSLKTLTRQLSLREYSQ